jgi:hypothetical protein
MDGANGVNLPQSREAEQSVLGCILRDNSLLHRAMAILRKEDFYVHAHQLIFQALIDLIVEEASSADPVTLADHLKALNQTADIGGYAYIAKIWDSAPATANVLHYAGIVRDRAVHREIIHTVGELQRNASTPGARPNDLIEQARQRLGQLATIGDIAGSNDGRGEDTLAWKPFPTHLLPPVLRNYIDYAAESIMVDPGMLVLPVLCTVGGIIGNRYVCRVKSDWHEPAIFWGAVVAKSSTKKTPCFEAATAPIGSLQEAMEIRFAAELASYEGTYEEYRANLRMAETAEAKKDVGKPPQRPKRERILVDNITVETLLEILADNPGGLIMAMDELSGFFGSFMRYRQAGAGSDRPLWLRMFNGKRIGYDRKTGDRKSLFIRHAATSIIGMIQPSILSGLFSDEAYQSGLAARFLLMYPPKRPRVYSEAEIPSEVKQAYRKLCEELQAEYLTGMQANDWQPRAVEMDGIAKQEFIRFYNAWGVVQDAAEGEEEYALAKLEGYAPRFALLLAVVESKTTGEYPVISEIHIQKAEEIVRWFAREICRVYDLLRRGGHEGDDDAVLAWVRSQGGKVTVRDMMRSKLGQGKKAEDCRYKLNALVITGKAEWQTLESKQTGGRPSTHLVLSSKLGVYDKTDI